MSQIVSVNRPPPISRTSWAIAIGLVSLTFLTFLPVLRCGFTDFDDPEYVTNNQPVLDGLSRADVHWAWTTTHAGYWQPLSWMSLMLDATLTGRDAAGFHRTNLILHALSAGLVFLVVSRMSGTIWRAALVAVLYAVHPLRVESVAWVAERKDVLSNLFAWLTLGGYVAYCRAPNSRRFLLVLIPFCLGLLAKPMIVTLPCLMLLLDYWPMKRWGWPANAEPAFAPVPLKRLIIEKIPLFLLALAAGLSAVRSQAACHAMLSLALYPLSKRIPSILLSYSLYLWKMVWYPDLIAFYPLKVSWLEQPWPWTRWASVVAAVAILLALTMLSIFQRRQRPWLIVGWLWFVGVLLPVSGVFQAGPQLLADRFSYLPSVGLLVMLVWSIPQPRRWTPNIPWFTGAIAGAVVIILCTATWIQSSYWLNSRTLFTRAMSVDYENWLAHDEVSLSLYRAGNLQAAINECAQALALNPTDPAGNYNMGLVLARTGHDAEAIKHYRVTLVLEPAQYEVHASLGVSLQRLGELSDAYDEFKESIAIKPNYAAAHSDMGGLLAQIGLLDKAIPELQLALRLNPKDKPTQKKLQYALKEFSEKSKKPTAVADTGNK
jgi:protein O-mannosyl-transferase